MSGTLGTALEFYDFAIYGLAAGTVFKEIFFHGANPSLSLFASLATFAIGYFARPVGGMFLGAVGDRVGRKAILQWTVIIMGLASTLIGLLPTYASIGLWAPAMLVLLRIVQGIGAGAEMASSSALLVETAPGQKRGFFGAMVAYGTNGGTLLAAIVWLLINKLPEDDFYSWGWRVPFLLSIGIAVFGLWVRRNVQESPAHLANVKQGKTLGLVENYAHIIKNSRKTVLACILLRWGENGISTIFLVFLVGQSGLISHQNPQIGSLAVLISAVFAMAMVPVAGFFSDRIGRRKCYLALSLFQFIVALPVIYFLYSGQSAWIVLAFILPYSIGVTGMYAVQSAWMVELFGARTRLAAITSSKELGALTSGGIAPVICAALLAAYGNLWVIGGYMMLLAFVSTIAAVMLPETAGRDLADEHDAIIKVKNASMAAKEFNLS
ncbi:MFS transporter [Cedecea colo]|uniref:MFS transporter n=1 Tax=Cedecea colo TaxID=2552946 RepID=UPI0030842467